MTKFKPHSKRPRSHGPAWVRNLRHKTPNRRFDTAITILKVLGIPIPRGRYVLPVIVGVIFTAGIAIGIGIALLTARDHPETIIADAPPNHHIEPFLIAPPSAQNQTMAPEPKTDVETPTALPLPNFSPPAFLKTEPEPAPERGEEAVADSYQSPEVPAPTPPEPPVVAIVTPEPPPPTPAHRPMEAVVKTVVPESLGQAGDPPWRRFAVPTAPANGHPQIAVVIDDLGIDRGRTAQIIKLPAPLTASYLTYAHDLLNQTKTARANGHELMIHVPMEPRNSVLDAGPGVLLTSHSDTKLQQLLADVFTHFPSFVGINNHMGSKFTSDSHGMAVVMQELKSRGLLFLDSRTANDSVGAEVARHNGVPYAVRDVFLDNEPIPSHITARLAEVEHIAKTRGYAIAIGHPRDGTIEALRAWLPTLSHKGLTLVPLSSIVYQKMGAIDKAAVQHSNQ